MISSIAALRDIPFYPVNSRDQRNPAVIMTSRHH
jgi:hypothetical protein